MVHAVEGDLDLRKGRFSQQVCLAGLVANLLQLLAGRAVGLVKLAECRIERVNRLDADEIAVVVQS